MKFRTLVQSISRTLGGKTLITLVCDADPAKIEQLKGELDCELATHREKRSLNANSYYHVLCGKIAEKVGTSMTEVCNQMIADYGQVDEDIKSMILEDRVNWLKLNNLHLRPTTKTQVMANGRLYRCYFVMRGSHTYNTKEMATLIRGVISEAEELGISTLTPAEINSLLNAWGDKSGV